MNIEETKEILNFASLVDGREFHPNAPEAWSEILSDVPVEEARVAVVAHYRESTERLMPADLNLHRKTWEASHWDSKFDEDLAGLGRDEIRERKFKEDAYRLGIDPSSTLKGV